MSKLCKDKVGIEQTYAKFVIDCTNNLTSVDDINEALDAIINQENEIDIQKRLLDAEKQYLLYLLNSNEPEEGKKWWTKKNLIY